MRLFIAITLDDDVKEKLFTVAQNLKTASISGNFTLRENLHLTLAFIGETERAKDVISAMDAVSSAPVELVFQGIGSFKRPGGELFWIGLNYNDRLSQLYKCLYDALVREGFKLESRAFKPHLTLGREVILKSGFDIKSFSQGDAPLKMTAEKISLMKSERIGGRMVYTEIYKRALRG